MAEGDGAEGWRVAPWKGDRAEEGRKEWEVVRMLRSGLKEFERRSLSSDMFAGFRGRGEFVEKFKLSLVILNPSIRYDGIPLVLVWDLYNLFWKLKNCNGRTECNNSKLRCD